MGRENYSLQPVGGRQLPPDPSIDGNPALSFQGLTLLAYLQPDGTHQGWGFTPFYTVHTLLFMHDYLHTHNFFSRSWNTSQDHYEQTFGQDGDQGLVWPGANGIYTPQLANPIEPRQIVKGRTLTNGIQVQGYYINGFVQWWGTGYYSLWVELGGSTPIVNGFPHNYFQGQFPGPALRQEIPVVLREDQYTQIMADAGNKFSGPHWLGGTVYYNVVGIWAETNP